MIVTIDGPAGAGKSTAARGLAQRLGFQFLDTGAMYRAVALAALGHKVSWDDPQALAELASQVQIDVRGQRVSLNGKDVTEAIRTMEVTAMVHHVANNPAVRRHLVQQQRRIAAAGDFVTEGRDQGTVVFPDAICKIFLTASPEERARRRLADLVGRSEELEMDEILRQQEERDQRDRSRRVGPLAAAEDAITVDTEGRTLEQVIDELERHVRGRLPRRK